MTWDFDQFATYVQNLYSKSQSVVHVYVAYVTKFCSASFVMISIAATCRKKKWAAEQVLCSRIYNVVNVIILQFILLL